ncbi:MAG: hypothetical protein LBQ27_00780 [Clostridiales bacterium]|jgi:hypothetical protein|nr:hypothetical protein [Clostridiales bacterium]
MPTIEFRENKVLKLINVLSRKVPEAELFSTNKQIMMLQNWIKAKGYETQGPLIMYSTGITGIDADNNPIIDSRLLIQLKTDKVRLEIPYRFEKEIRIENCLMARFNDEAEKLQFATNKLTLFAYENDIELTGESYIVMIKQEEKNLLADVFMPVKKSEE